MSHFDSIVRAPDGLRRHRPHRRHAGRGARARRARGIYGVQFHPEVVHTPARPGAARALPLRRVRLPRRRGRWRRSSRPQSRRSAAQVGDGRAICGLSGGVDSAVAAALVHRAIGPQLTCVFVDTGLMREGEGEQVVETFRRHQGIELIHVDAADRFFERLARRHRPRGEAQGHRRAVHPGVRGARRRHRRRHASSCRARCTPTSSSRGTADAAKIKSHHNVGGLPEDMDVRAGRAAARAVQGRGAPASATSSACPTRSCGASRSPGPGSACASSARSRRTRSAILQQADAIVREEIHDAGLEREIWQAFAVLPDIRSVGVMGDERTYGHPIIIRAVTSEDAMTADWARLPYDLLERMSSRIINEVRGHQPGGLRHHVEAARHHRVGVTQGDRRGSRLGVARARTCRAPSPPFSFALIAGGRSNLTYAVTDAAGRRVVLRRPPLGHVLATAHDMAREHRIISALVGTAVPVPTTFALCTDTDVNGAPFYVMSYVEASCSTARRRAPTLPAAVRRDAGLRPRRRPGRAPPRRRRCRRARRPGQADRLRRAAAQALVGAVARLEDPRAAGHRGGRGRAPGPDPRPAGGHHRPRGLPLRQLPRRPRRGPAGGRARLGALHAGGPAGRRRLPAASTGPIRATTPAVPTTRRAPGASPRTTSCSPGTRPAPASTSRASTTTSRSRPGGWPSSAKGSTPATCTARWPTTGPTSTPSGSAPRSSPSARWPPSAASARNPPTASPGSGAARSRCVRHSRARRHRGARSSGSGAAPSRWCDAAAPEAPGAARRAGRPRREPGVDGLSPRRAPVREPCGSPPCRWAPAAPARRRPRAWAPCSRPGAA